jgi:hypothetical protein
VNRRVLPTTALVVSLLHGGLGRAEERSVDAATPADTRDAQTLYTTGMGYFDHDDYDSALKAFQDSYSHVKSPNSHFMIARTLARLGRNVEAYAALQQVIAECQALDKRYADTAHAAEEKLTEVRSRIGLVTLKAGRMPKDTRILVADEPVATLEKPVPVLPGDTEIVAVTKDGKKHSQTVTVRAGGDATATIDIAPEVPPEKSVVENDTAHPPYLIEAEAHVVGETIAVSNQVTRGAGPGLRANVDIVPKGILPGINDDIAVGTGIDWIASSYDPHVTVPIVGQWNFWVIDDLSLFIEPGIGLTFGAGTHVTPSFYAGARVRIWKSVHIVGRVGIPNATLGASVLF